MKKPEKLCNCNKASLPCVMGGKCVEGSVVYEGAVTRLDTGQTEFYTGLSEPSWKLRWNNHKANFKTDTNANRTATCLSKHIWKLKDKKLDQETWFCRTHLDDFLSKNLVYFRPYKNQVKSGYKGIPIEFMVNFF